ncbi:hypothetical protein C900_02834 [Fulvivirga imtechensis AK7]|uniref:Uncharacterized protein n=1 Tax=Fulvivirga imtechensis AK7 TaxID=1237149 RepID=L8JT16_9BACT|nr:hypothetical protein [Fulvivirga imtechensis]ELR71333.1 hypothetical protein C900_02834 [Fulvivirga imtechensis AK7]
MKKVLINHYGKIIGTRYYESLPKTIICPHCHNERRLQFTPFNKTMLCNGDESGLRYYHKSCLALFELMEE